MLSALRRMRTEINHIQRLGFSCRYLATVTTKHDNDERSTGVEHRLSVIKERGYPLDYDHPKARFNSIEYDVLTKLVDIKAEQRISDITIDFVKSLYVDAMTEHHTAELSKQLIADTMTSLIVKYEDDLVTGNFTTLIPTATKQLGVDSTLLLCMCLAPFCNEEKLSAKEDKFVVNILDSLQSRPDLANLKDHTMTDQIISKATSASSRWRDAALQALESRQLRLDPYLIKAVLRNEDYDLALQLIAPPENKEHRAFVYEKKISVYRRTHKECITALVTSLPANRLPDFLDIISSLELGVSEEAAPILLQSWRTLLRGECLNCGSVLRTETISADEMTHLKTVFYNKSIVDAGVYSLTHPEELMSFVQFIRESDPFDLVVDGLNLFHIAQRRQKNTVIFIQHAVGQIKDLISKSRSKRILIITRKHGVKSIPPEIKAIATIYAVKNSAADDVFSVYAALSSGPQCYLLSSDSFRQHNKYIKLQPGDDKFIFAKWQRLRTVPRYIDHWPPGSNYKVGRHLPGTYRHGLKTILNPHKCDGAWHVPVTPDALYNYSTRMPHNHQWLCLPTIDTDIGKRVR